MNILITGGNGYIAKKIYQHFEPYQCKITKITRADFDLTDYQSTFDWFREKTFDVVFHTAISGGSRLTTDTHIVTEQNLKMYYNLLACRDKFNKFISFGSGAEIFSPTTPYGMSKKIIADSIQQIPNFYNIRIFGVFDEDELPTRFIKSNILNYLEKKPMVIHADTIMDFFYMNDLMTILHYYVYNKDLPKETNCSYRYKSTLSGITEYINSLSKTYEVPVQINSREPLQFYCGSPCELPLVFHGLFRSIYYTYLNIKGNLYNDTSNSV